MAAAGLRWHGALLGGGASVSSSSSESGGRSTDPGSSSDGEPHRMSSWTHDSAAFRRMLDFAQVREEEAMLIEKKRALLQEGPCQTFSLAFSGGGVRAAAFQSGVLWRLAEQDRMRSIDCFSAVSGGGYVTSALASHIIEKELQQGRPEPGAAREWYLDAVCSTILRMQRNAGDFVRDSWRRPGVPEDGAGLCPRILDLPLLIVMVVATLLINPLSFLVLIVVPATVAIELHYGAAMRAAFCAPLGSDWIELFWLYSDFARVVGALPVSVAVTFVAFVLHKTCFSRRQYKRGAVSPFGYLLAKNSVAALSRLTVLVLLLIMILFLVPCLQIMSNGVDGCESRKRQCLRYINAEMSKTAAYRSSHPPKNLEQKEMFGTINALIAGPTFANGTGILDSCADLMSNRPWFVQDPFIALNARDFCFDGRNITKQTVTAEYSDMGTSDIATLRVVDEFVRHMYHVFVKDNQSLIGWFLAFIVMALLGAVVAMPFTGSSFVAVIAWSAGPCLLFLVLLVFIQFRVFGPLTFHPFLGVFRWNLRGWQAFVSSCFVIALFVPMYQELRSIWHRYYRYSLQTNFFACGRDRLLHELRESACCPHVILTGTVNDYRTTGAEKEDTVAEISFSSLHLGSGKLGYCRSPRWESLSKLTALTGAGCLDAAALSLNSQSAALKMRFWLEVLNLSWGDYVLFGQHQGHAWRCVEDLGRRAAKRCPGWEGMFVYASHRITPGTALCVTYLLMNLAWHLKSADMAFTCHLARTVSVAAFGLLLFILALSFFASCPALQWTMFSPWLRQIHQGIAHQYEGPSPPGLLYVTDGGVADCTTLVQLMMRGSERILLVLAAADPDDDLGVLRAAMDVARKEKIGGFFDPADARRDVNILFDEFKQSRDKTWMHVGIRYGWDGPEAGRKLGHLVIVKNRLPDQFKSRPCHPPLTEDEIKHGPGKTSRRPSEDAERLDMNSDELGPWGCCDCCHGLCNCGPKFPHGNFAGYLYLTPAWFNELCRLGYDISQEAVDALFTLRFDEGLAAARA